MYTHRIVFMMTLALSLQSGCAVDDASIEVHGPDAGAEFVDAGVEIPADAGQLRAFGESCVGAVDCEDSLCVDSVCSAVCQPSDVNSCSSYDTMCVVFTPVPGACLDVPLSLGDDFDDNRGFGVGTVLLQQLPVGDADLFRLYTAPGGKLWLHVAPSARIDVAIDVYTNRGDLWLTIDDAGVGKIEGAELTPDTPAKEMFAVVRNLSDMDGTFVLRWACDFGGCDPETLP